MKRKILAITVLFSLGLLPVDWSFGQGSLNRRFAQGPKVGELLPDVTANDEQGKPLKLRDLKDKYTVLVFGCLT